MRRLVLAAVAAVGVAGQADAALYSAWYMAGSAGTVDISIIGYERDGTSHDLAVHYDITNDTGQMTIDGVEPYQDILFVGYPFGEYSYQDANGIYHGGIGYTLALSFKDYTPGEEMGISFALDETWQSETNEPPPSMWESDTPWTYQSTAVYSSSFFFPGIYVGSFGPVNIAYTPDQSVAPVPLPAAAPMLLTGAAFIGGLRLRARRRSQVSG